MGERWEPLRFSYGYLPFFLMLFIPVETHKESVGGCKMSFMVNFHSGSSKLNTEFANIVNLTTS
jgi:hypothetical protein